MKLVIAIVKPEKLEDVRQELIKAGISRVTVHHATGHGRTKGDPSIYRGQVIAPNLSPKIRMEIACNDEFVEPAIEAILQGARSDSGEMGDGKIMVLPIEQCIRIRTGERGNEAI